MVEGLGFLAGMASSTHCMAMCGPLVLSLPVHTQPGWRKWWLIAVYHFFRIYTYALLGLVLGSLGFLTGMASGQKMLSIVSGILLILFVIFSHKKFLGRFNLGKGWFAYVQKFRHFLLPRPNPGSAYTYGVMGMINGLLPCGMIYMMLLPSLAMGSSWQGAGYMLLFGLGTLPALLTIHYVRDRISQVFKDRLMKVVPGFLLITGVVLILRGLNEPLPSSSNAPLTITYCRP